MFIVASTCINTNGRDADCADWASYGECQGNPEYMKMNCQKACGTCDFTKPSKSLIYSAIIPNGCLYVPRKKRVVFSGSII